MKQKNHFTLNRYTTGALALLLIVAATTVIVLQRSHTDAAPAVRSKASAIPSHFSFTGASGWWQGATNSTSMAVFHASHDCFVSTEYKSGTVDTATELQKIQSTLTSSGYVVGPGAIQTLSLQTNTGAQQYELHQFVVSTPTGADKVEGGQAYGYVQLSDGYVKVMAQCDTADQVPATISVLQAVKFNSQ